MIWFLVLLGILLILLGMWGGPAAARKRRELEVSARAKAPTVGEAWEIISRPLQDEAIKIPQHRPWTGAGDRRFARGLFVGFGAGLLIAAIALAVVPRGPAKTVAQSITPPLKATTPGPGTPQGGQTPPVTTPPVTTPPVTTPPKPPTVSFTVAYGDAASTIADNLQKAGLIKNTGDFLARLTQLQAETRLKAGTFTVPTNATLDDVINVLTA